MKFYNSYSSSFYIRFNLNIASLIFLSFENIYYAPMPSILLSLYSYVNLFGVSPVYLIDDTSA
jgi:hypothetical protein